MAQTQLLQLSGTVSWSPASFTPASPSACMLQLAVGWKGAWAGSEVSFPTWDPAVDVFTRQFLSPACHVP